MNGNDENLETESALKTSSATTMSDIKFKSFLLQISEELTKDNVSSLLFLIKLPAAVKERIKDGKDLFTELCSRQLISADDVSLLVRLLNEISRMDLAGDVKKYQQEKGLQPNIPPPQQRNDTSEPNGHSKTDAVRRTTLQSDKATLMKTGDFIPKKPIATKGEKAWMDVTLADRKMPLVPEDSLDTEDGVKEKPLDILLLCSEWGSSKGGLSTFNRQIAIHLAKQPKLKVHCYLPEVSEIDKRNAAEVDVHLIAASSVPGEMYYPLLKLHKLSPEILSPDVVISHGRKFGTAGFFLKKDFPSCKWVHFVHVDCEEMGKHKVGHDPVAEHIEKDKKEIELCEAADLVIAVGPQLEEKYSRSLYAAAKKVEIFYPGLSTEFLHLPQTNRDPNEFHVYMFGRGAEEDFKLKGFDVAANAVGKLGMNYRLYAVCAPHKEADKTRQYFLDKTEITNDQLYVHEYCNDREQLKKMMGKASVVVMPSRAEAFGLIGLEALSAGVPVLVSAKSGFGITLKELPFDSGCVVEGDIPDVWAEKIELLSRKDRSKRNESIVFVRTQYGDRYKWGDQCSRLVQLFLSK